MKRIFLLLCALTIALAACGGSDSGSGSTSATTAASGQGGFADYQNCLSDNGVKLDLPSNGQMGNGGSPPEGFTPPAGGSNGQTPGISKPDNVDQATWDKAQSACESKRPQMGQGGAQGSSATDAFQSCLKDHGVDMSNTSTTVDRNSDAFKKAQEACSSLLPSSTTTTGATS